MKRIYIYIVVMLTTLLGIAGCESPVDHNPELPERDDYIKLYFAPYGTTRGTIEDNECESFLSHLDVVIYKVNGEGSTYEGFYHERVNVTDTPDGVTSIKRTKQDFEQGAKYKVYVIANSDVDESVYYQSDKVVNHDTFLKLDQTNRNIHLSGIDFGNPDFEYPNMFLMDGVAYMGTTEPAQGGAIVINDGTTDDVTLKVTLRRAAAKIIVTIKPGDKVTFDPKLMAKSQGYLLRNMPIRTTLTAEGGYPLTEGDTRPYWTSPTISQSPYFQLVKDESDVYSMQIIAYCYSHTWESAEVFYKGTSLVVMLPMIYKESEGSAAIEYINNYYQLSIRKSEAGGSEHFIKRNTLYDLRVTLNAPGAEDYTAPEEIKDLEYFTTPWKKVDLDVSGETPVKYLKVNKEKLYMYNISDDATSLYFSSSSPVTVSYVSGSGHYYNKYNVKTTLKDNAVDIYATTEVGSVSGNISVHSDIPTNNTIRYFQIKVTNQEGLSEIIDVEQYPLIYITNGLPWYSYRDDYYYRTTGGHKWNGSVSSSTTSGDSPTTYQYDGDHIVSIYTIDNVDVKTKTVKYTYSSAAASTSNGGTGWTVSKVRGNKQNNSENYAIQYYYFTYRNRRWTKNETNCENHNVRNYHVRMMASSDEYTLGRPALDEYGYTAGDADNAKLVSPSFVIASRLGAVLSTYSNLSSMSNDKKLIAFADHCKNYVEVDDENDDKKDPVKVYDNWRLPTEAELKIIIEIQGKSGQNADAIDYLLNGAYYMSASGPVYNPKNSDGTKELADPMKATDVAIRCVRDAYE